MWNLRALDRKFSAFFIPSDYKEFGKEVIEHGRNYTTRLGFGIWNLNDFKTEFDRGMQLGFPASALSLPNEAVALCTLASLLFPDRLPLVLERALAKP